MGCFKLVLLKSLGSQFEFGGSSEQDSVCSYYRQNLWPAYSVLWDLVLMVGRTMRNGENFDILDEKRPRFCNLQFNEWAFPAGLLSVEIKQVVYMQIPVCFGE